MFFVFSSIGTYVYFFPPRPMVTKRILSGLAAASMALTAFPAAALDLYADTNTSVDASVTTSNTSANADVDTSTLTDVQLKRCERFRTGDYERCVRIMKKVNTSLGSQVRVMAKARADADSTVDRGTVEWKWKLIGNRIDAKLKAAFHMIGKMAHHFCSDDTDENDQTISECMADLKATVQARVMVMIDAAFRVR